MSLLPHRLGNGLLLFALALALFSSTLPVRAQEESKKVDAAPPATPAPTTATSEPLPGESSYQIFKQELFKPFENWKSGGATEPVLAIRPVAPPVSVKQSEAAEKERNWMFNGMNELNGAEKRDDLQKLSNPNPAWGERSKSSIEKYYDRTGRNSANTNSIGGMINALARDPMGLDAMNPMNFMIPGSEQLLRKMILPWETNSLVKNSDASASNNSTTQDKADEDRDNQWSKEFKHMIDPTSPAPPPRGVVQPKDPFEALNTLMTTGLGASVAGPATIQLPGPQAVGATSPVLGAANPMTGAFQLPSAASAPVKPIIPDTVQKLLAQPEKPVMVKPTDPASLMPRRKF